LARVQSRNISI
ncbi:hypothetical protein VCHC65A1_03353B, partial [Vibrio cholerae HC-65A1]